MKALKRDLCRYCGKPVLKAEHICWMHGNGDRLLNDLDRPSAVFCEGVWTACSGGQVICAAEPAGGVVVIQDEESA